MFLQFLPVKSRSETTEGSAIVGDLQSDEQANRVGALCWKEPRPSVLWALPNEFTTFVFISLNMNRYKELALASV